MNRSNMAVGFLRAPSDRFFLDDFPRRQTDFLCKIFSFEAVCQTESSALAVSRPQVRAADFPSSASNSIETRKMPLLRSIITPVAATDYDQSDSSSVYRSFRDEATRLLRYGGGALLSPRLQEQPHFTEIPFRRVRLANPEVQQSAVLPHHVEAVVRVDL